MAISTENTYLIVKESSTWKKVVDIISFPDMGGAPATIDTTTLSNHMKTSVPGLVDPGNLEFEANYTKADYTTVKEMEGADKDYGIQFGKDGADGVYTFKGKLACWIKGGGVEEAVKMGISIAPSTDIVPGGSSDKATIQ